MGGENSRKVGAKYSKLLIWKVSPEICCEQRNETDREGQGEKLDTRGWGLG